MRNEEFITPHSSLRHCVGQCSRKSVRIVSALKKPHPNSELLSAVRVGHGSCETVQGIIALKKGGIIWLICVQYVRV